MKTCNGGNCEFKIVLSQCNYTGYCDYQCPKDSRSWTIMPVSPTYQQCLCGQTGTMKCPIHGNGGKEMTAKTVRDVLDDLGTGSVSNLTTDMALEQIRAAMPSVKDIMDEIELRHGCTVEMYETATAIRELMISKLQ